MAARKQTHKAPEKPENPPILAPDGREVVEVEAPDAIAAINALANSDAGADWEIQVYEVTGAPNQGAKQPWLFNIDVTELRGLRMRLSELFPAGGRYRVVCRVNDRIYKSFYLDIAKRVGFSTMPAVPERAQAPAPQSAIHDPLELVREMQREQREFFKELVGTLRAQPAAPAPVTLTDRLEELKALRELMPPAPTNIGLELFEKGMTFGERIASAGDGGGGGRASMISELVGLARDFISSDAGKVVAQTMLAGNAQPAPANEGPAVRAPVLPAPLVQNPRPSPANDGPALSLDQLVELLVQRAAKNEDPALAADWVFETVPDALLDQLDQIPDPLQMLMIQYPMAAPFKPWFESLLENMQQDATTPGEHGEGDNAEGKLNQA